MPGGSPPLARGSPGLPGLCAGSLRFTPACAGKPDAGRPDRPDALVHPRLRGEAAFRRMVSERRSGSPPLARGSPRPAGLVTPRRRFTPACAGKPCGSGSAGGVCAVHPRLRGEALPGRQKYAKTAGSPPLARGSRHCRFRARSLWRFTPACAGKPARADPRPRPDPVHPRLRGEARLVVSRPRPTCGSPPLARGSRFLDLYTLIAQRFTPACAGKPDSVPIVFTAPTVHPRLRGEALIGLGIPALEAGSPPLARGSPDKLAHLLANRRFTPACAGKPAPESWQVRPWSVHPRLRGEATKTTLRVSRPVGSPPLARGSRPSTSRNAPRSRFTPACAGKPGRSAWNRASNSVHPRLRGEAGRSC